MPEKPADPTLAFADDAEAVWTPPPWPKDCPQPGVYPGIPFDEYRAWPAVNASALKMGWEVSPLHMRAVLDGRLHTDSRARKFGRAVHGRLLEPDTYAERFPLADPCAATLKSGHRKGEPCHIPGTRLGEAGLWYCGKHATDDDKEPADYVTAKDEASIERMAVSVYQHKVSAMLHAHGGCEVSLLWERDGIPCKARFDKMIVGQSCPDTIIDLKKCQPCKASDDAVQKSVREYCWDLQAAWYRSGFRAIHGHGAHFAWIFLEDGEPFDVRPLWASKAMLELGDIKVRRAFGTYKHCVETGEWPGYCSSIETLGPSDYEIKKWGLNA